MTVCGLDIGGTNLKVALFDEDGRMTFSRSAPSEAKQGKEALLRRVTETLDALSFDALGVSTAGMVGEDGSITYANDNIPGYTGTPLRAILAARYGKPTAVLNDIVAAALAEEETGGEDYYYLSLGTGVGGIHVVNGVPRLGTHRMAGQIGYLPSWHATSVIDRESSASGLERRAGKDGKAVFSEAMNGDASAKDHLAAFGVEIAHTVALIRGFCDPAVIVIGGAISRQGEALLSLIRESGEVIPEPYRKDLLLRTARGGEYSGAAGAARYMRYMKKRPDER